MEHFVFIIVCFALVQFSSCVLRERDDRHFLVVQGPRIIRVNARNGNDSKRTVETGSHVTRPVALDYDYEDGLLFYSDGRRDGHMVRRKNLNGTGNATDIVFTDIATGIAVDWIANVVFWCNEKGEPPAIRAAKYDGSNVLDIVRTDLTSPRGLAVHPLRGYLFWTDWAGNNPNVTAKIERSWLDGQNREEIISTSLGYPNGVTIDYVTSRLFWTDARLDRIESSNLDGSSRVVIRESEPHPYSITVAGFRLYWTDWGLDKVMTCNKEDGSDRKTFVVLRTPGVPFDVKYVSRKRQYGITPCAVENGGCSGLCLMRGDGLHTCA